MTHDIANVSRYYAKEIKKASMNDIRKGVLFIKGKGLHVAITKRKKKYKCSKRKGVVVLLTLLPSSFSSSS